MFYKCAIIVAILLSMGTWCSAGVTPGPFAMDLTGMDTGSVHTNLFSPYQAPDVRLSAESIDPFFVQSTVCCPPAIIGFSSLGSPINVTVVGFVVDTVYPDKEGLFYWPVPDWMIQGQDAITLVPRNVV